MSEKQNLLKVKVGAAATVGAIAIIFQAPQIHCTANGLLGWDDPVSISENQFSTNRCPVPDGIERLRLATDTGASSGPEIGYTEQTATDISSDAGQLDMSSRPPVVMVGPTWKTST